MAANNVNTQQTNTSIVVTRIFKQTRISETQVLFLWIRYPIKKVNPWEVEKKIVDETSFKTYLLKFLIFLKKSLVCIIIKILMSDKS